LNWYSTANNTPQLAEADLATQAQRTAGTLGQTLQSGVANAGTTFNRFVEGDSQSSTSREPAKKDFWDSFGDAPKGPAKDKQDFWDEFGAAGEARTGAMQERKKPSGIGTSAVKKGGSASGSGGKKEDGEWGEW
jgi:ADP-ribosylation factor GTPase-activating protein 1